MTDHSAVIFNTSGNPRISYGEIARTYNGILIHQITLRFFIIKRPHSSAEIRQENGAQILIFQHRALILLFL